MQKRKPSSARSSDDIRRLIRSCPHASASTTSGYIMIDPGPTRDAETAAHELFHLLQYAIYARGAKFLKEGTAEWAGANVARGTSWLFSYWGSPDQPLDCSPTSPCGTSDCS